MEAMVCSDNVVRGGLTPKFKDAKTLVEILPFEYKERQISGGDCLFSSECGDSVTEYKTGYSEFMVTCVNLGNTGHDNKFDKQFNSMAIAMVMNGNAQADTQYGKFTMSESTCYLIPAGTKVSIMSETPFKIFIASCDI